MRLLDLFCGAGGAAMGYHQAGFEIVGVDINPQPHYPFKFHQADALEFDLSGFDVIHASPPCQAYSTMTSDPSKHPQLIDVIRQRLLEWGAFYVIENVEGARRHLNHPTLICGSSLGLKVRRHRYFETNFFLTGTPCAHNIQGVPIGVYGDHPEPAEYLRPGSGTRRGVKAKSLQHAQEAMGINWMTYEELAEAIPPVYCEFIGEQLLSVLRADDGRFGGSSHEHTHGTSAFLDRKRDSDQRKGVPEDSVSSVCLRPSAFAASEPYSQQWSMGRGVQD